MRGGSARGELATHVDREAAADVTLRRLERAGRCDAAASVVDELDGESAFVAAGERWSASAPPTRSGGPRRPSPRPGRAPYGELRLYADVDHFDIYDGPEHEAVVADQLGWRLFAAVNSPWLRFLVGESKRR
jgi:hypothetical protein